MEAKHICIVTRNLGAGGAERVIVQLLGYLVQNNYRATLILMENAPVHYEIPSAVSLVVIGKRAKGALADKLLSYRALRKKVRALAPDTVLVMPEEIGIYAMLALIGVRTRRIVSERNDPARMPYRRISRVLRPLAYRFADGIIFQTRAAANFFPKWVQKKSVVLPNPLDLSRLPAPFDGERDNCIVGAGRLEAQKNFPLLIRAFARFYQAHPAYRLVIFGEGSCRAALEREIVACGLPEGTITLPGCVSDLPVRINTATAFVLSSDYEGMPNVLIEALACGVPSVATDCSPGGAAALIEHEKNGMLCPIGDEEAIASALSRIVEDAAFAATLSANAVAIREKLEISRICEKWISFLTKKETKG